MAKHDGGFVWGRTYDPVQWDFQGDISEARNYIGIGRQILGELKRYMQLSEIQTHAWRKTLRNGVVIVAMSIISGPGMADIDQISIYAPPSRGGSRCIGYIVQGLDVDGLAANSYSYQFKQISPTGLVFERSLPSGFTDDTDTPASMSDFPDNGAKYLTWFKTADGAESDYQVVVPAINQIGYEYSGIGPTTRVVVPWDGVSQIGIADLIYATKPPLNPGWTYVDAYTYSEGTCSGGGTWVEEATPCGPTYRTTTLVGCENATPKTYSTTLHGPTPVYERPYYSGGHSDPGGFCLRTETNWPLDALMSSGANWFALELTEYYTTQTALWNTLSEAYYAKQMECYLVSGSTFEYEMSVRLTPTYSVFAPVGNKRSDDHGFFIAGGFYFESGLINLTLPYTGSGVSTFFMVPLKSDDRKFRYETDIQDRANFEILGSDSNYFLDNDFAVGSTAPELAECGFSADVSVGYNPVLVDESSDPNMTRKSVDRQGMTDTFGVPIDVEPGYHTIEAYGSSGGKTMRVKVWLILESETYPRIVTTTKEFASGNSGADAQIRIKVGDFDNISELVKFEQL